MTSNENFKQALIAGKLDEALAIAISQAPELKITTSIVSSLPQAETDSNSPSPNFVTTKRLHTRINLVEGEIHNEISEDLIGNIDSQELQKFHFEQVSKGHQIIQKNLESLQNIFRLMTTVRQQQLAGNYRTDVKYLNPDKTTLPSEPRISENGDNAIAADSSELLESIDEVDDSAKLTLDKSKEQNGDLIKERSEPVTKKQNDEDWGEWLEEENEQDIDVDLLDLSSLELDDSEEWQDWEDEETQLFASTPANTSEDKSEDKKNKEIQE